MTAPDVTGDIRDPHRKDAVAATDLALDFNVKRIEDVSLLRNTQFREDAGPTAHPIQPDQYQAIDNFYTTTIYEKGSEVIRVLHTLLGPQKFRAASDLYFQRHDGEAATCEDFVVAMEDASGIDLPDRLDRLHRAANVVFVASRAREHQRIDDDVFRRNPVLLRQQINGPLCHRQLPLTRERLRLHFVFIDGADHQCRAVRLRDRANMLEFFFAVFEVDRIDDALSLAPRQRMLNRFGIGGIDHHRRLDLGHQLRVEGIDILELFAL